MSRIKEALANNKFVRAGTALTVLGVGGINPNFEVSKANAQMNGAPVVNSVDCESAHGIKKNSAVVMLGKDGSINISDNSKHYQVGNTEEGLRVDAWEEGEQGSRSILVPPGSDPTKTGKEGQIYITSGERSLPLQGKTVKVRAGEGNQHGRVTHIGPAARKLR